MRAARQVPELHLSASGSRDSAEVTEVNGKNVDELAAVHEVDSACDTVEVPHADAVCPSPRTKSAQMEFTPDVWPSRSVINLALSRSQSLTEPSNAPVSERCCFKST